jgi:predicted ABC-type ATPase
MNNKHPHLVIIAGPNGAGKSTTAPYLLKGALKVTEFVNADIIAQGLSAFQPELTAFSAGRIMLERLRYLARKRFNFAFETTLSSRTFAPWIAKLRKTDYDFRLVFLWLPSEELAINRVAERVRMGGHNVPQEIIRRRYHSGIHNFFRLYHPLADSWFFYDNSGAEPRLIAHGGQKVKKVVIDEVIWHNIERQYER